MWGKTKSVVLKTGQTYTYHITLRRDPPLHYTGRRFKLRDWDQVPMRLEVDVARCQVEGTPRLVQQSSGQVTWEIRLTPREPGWTTLFLFCKGVNGEPFAEAQQCLQIEGAPQPLRQVEPMKPPTPPSERHVLVDMSDPAHHSGYEVDGTFHPYPHARPAKKILWELRQDTIEKVGAVAREQNRSATQWGDLPRRISDQLTSLFGQAWWSGLPPAAHITLVHPHYALPFELALAEGQMWGMRFGLGHLQRPSAEEIRPRKAKLVVIADSQNAPLGTLMDEFRAIFPATREGAAEISHILPERFSADVYKLRDMVNRAEANLIYLTGRVIPDSEGRYGAGLDLQLGQTHQLRLIPDLGLPAHKTGAILPRDAVIFVAPVGDSDLETTGLAHLFLSMGARAVIVPLCPLPETLSRAFALQTLNLLTQQGEQITLGRALAQARTVVPAGLGFVLWGDPRMRIKL